MNARDFFRGVWRGEGEVVPAWWVRWLVRRRRFRHESRFRWMSETTLVVEDRMEFEDGRVLARTMTGELVAPNRILFAADDLPEGAELVLENRGIRFAPYVLIVAPRPGARRFRFRCADESTIAPDGRILDVIHLRWHALPAAVIRIHVHRGG